jgi:hypothetical protein
MTGSTSRREGSIADLASSKTPDMPQIAETPSNAAQVEYWNSSAGETWAQFQEALDRQIEPLGLAAMDQLSPGEGEHILDIGCGCGCGADLVGPRRPSAANRYGRWYRYLEAHA